MKVFTRHRRSGKDIGIIDAVILDMDGVVTDTEKIHASAWKKTFDEYLKQREERYGEEHRPFEIETDYYEYLDGVPRYLGTGNFLESRGISLPEGDPEDPPERETVCGVGNRKNLRFLKLLKKEGARPHTSTVEFIESIRKQGVPVAVISASRNAGLVLESAEVKDLFDVIVEGNEARRLGLKGKPEPDIFLEAASRLNADPKRVAVVEDAQSGVKAARAGGFGVVIGVDRADQRDRLIESGADIVVDDLSELLEEPARSEDASALPSALDEETGIFETLQNYEPVVFLDYDGTLTPIVEDPEAAVLPGGTREVLERLSELCLVTVVSGRDLDDVRDMVGIEGIYYAGSHGFDIAGPDGPMPEPVRGEEILPDLDRAEEELGEALEGLGGVRVERKHYAIAVHFRAADEDDVPEVEKRFDVVLEGHPGLEKSPGKKIFEMRPAVEWDKGEAVLYLMGLITGGQQRRIPIYIGDDTTDEDAFRAIAASGLGIVVAPGERKTAARYVLGDTDEVMVFLEKLADIAEGRSSRECWVFAYEGFDPESEKLRETLCSTGNGYYLTRGAAPESPAGESHYPGTYMAGCYNRLVSEVAGQKIENESMVNIPNWLPLSIRVDDGEWLDAGAEGVGDYRQTLDMRRGLLKRSFVLTDEKGRRTTVEQRRFVSMDSRHLAGLETLVTPENWSGRMGVFSAVDGRVDNTLVKRYRRLNNDHLEQVDRGTRDDDIIWLRARTNQSNIDLAVAARTRLFSAGGRLEPETRDSSEEGHFRREFDLEVREGESIRIEKIASICSSRDPAISESVQEVLGHVGHAPGFEELLGAHARRWKHLWDRCGIGIEPEDGRTEKILNLHIFHLLQTVSVHSIDIDCGVPPRGLHGEAYRGLIMWDELFVFPILNLRIPDLTRELLKYRYRRMPRARWAAKKAGYEGAMFPWQSGSDGREEAQTLHLNPESGNWIEDNTHLERHISLAVAYNVWNYYQATADRPFLSFYGAEMIIEIARFWASRAEYNDETDRFEIRGIMGPDEFHDSYPDSETPGIDNNAYTNVMAVWVFCRALETLDLIPPDRRKSIWENLALSGKELSLWDRMSRKMHVPFHGDGIISQFDDYDRLEEFDWEGYRERYGDIERLDRILEAEGDTPNRYKVSKQADVLMLFYLFSAEELGSLFERLGYDFDEEAIHRNTDYYLKRTSNGSTLSRIVHSWVVSRSDREASWHLFSDALESDVSDIQGGTTHEGIHLGAMAGTVDLVQRCYTGLEAREDELKFDPRLPDALERIFFRIRYRGHVIDVELTRDRLRLQSGRDHVAPVDIACCGDRYTLESGRSLDIPLHADRSSTG